MCIYSVNTLNLGIMILVLSIRISVLIRLYYLSWLSLIFFIIYVGGLLVLFFYLSSLNYNPVFIQKIHFRNKVIIKINNIILLYLIRLYYFFKINNYSSARNYRSNLFIMEEFKSIILIGLVLLVLLWLVTKVTLNTRGALRPSF